MYLLYTEYRKFSVEHQQCQIPIKEDGKWKYALRLGWSYSIIFLIIHVHVIIIILSLTQSQIV